MWSERGINPATVETALNEAAEMTKEPAGGTVTAGVVAGNEALTADTSVRLSLVKINHIPGTSLIMEQVTDAFDRLASAYTVDDDDQLTVVALT